MPAFEFVIPQSFLFLPANFSFVSFCFFISFILSKIFKSAIVFFVLLIVLLSVAYGDLFLKYAIIKNIIHKITGINSQISL